MVGRIIRPHGLRGELSVEVRTDDPGQRFAVGSVLGTDPPDAGPLTVASTRWHSGRLLVTFADQTATAIENARLYTEVRAFSEVLEARVRARTAELEKANSEIERALGAIAVGWACWCSPAASVALGVLVGTLVVRAAGAITRSG